MKRKELTKTFMKISNKKTLGLHGLYMSARLSLSVIRNLNNFSKSGFTL